MSALGAQESMRVSSYMAIRNVRGAMVCVKPALRGCRLTQALWRCLCVALLFFVYGCPVLSPPAGDGFADGLADDSEDVQLAREIEEADIIKLQDGFFYLANPFTGLRLIDARNIDQPVMMGSVELGGRAIELFVRDDLAFVFTTADFLRCAGEPVGFESGVFSQQVAPDYQGSRVWVVDISDKESPSILNTFDLGGFISATRRVGDVIYIAGNNTFGSRSFGFDPGVFVDSINIADPENIFFVEGEVFIGASLEIHVSTEAMYVVGDDPQLSETSAVTYVDISDPGGDIVIRDQFRVPGRVENRFFVDEHDGVFRIVTEEFLDTIFLNVVALYNYDVSDPDDITRLARLPIVTGESLRAVRFDGDRGYAVTFRFIDPLFVLDLADPANPMVAGELEVPGFSTHLVPLGDRLIGVGFSGRGRSQPAVTLYDVADPAHPKQLSRIIIGGRFAFGTSSEATVDEKALRVIEEAGLILIPFSTFNLDAGEFVDALQIIGLEPRRLSERATIQHNGLVRRAGLLDTRVWILSDVSFQSVDVDDLDQPVSLAALDIITEQELLDAGLLSCADSARHRGRPLGGFSPGICGVLGFVPLLGMIMGLLFLQYHRRSTRETARS